MKEERPQLTACNSRVLVLALGHEEVFEELEGLANLLLADFRQVHDFAERAGHVVATTREEDTAGDHHLAGLALEKAALVSILVEMLRGVRDRIRQLPAITKRANLLVSLQQDLVALVVAGLVLSAMQFLAAHVAITKGDARVQLGAVEKSVGAVTDTARVVAALIVVGESAPLGAGVDGALLEDQTTVSADEITTRMIFAQVWWILATVAADHADIQILLPLFLLGWEELVRDGAG